VTRPTIQQAKVDEAVEVFKMELARRLKEKGAGTFGSIHEILGIIQEEKRELEDAVHERIHLRVAEELLDIAVGAVFGVACINSRRLDW